MEFTTDQVKRWLHEGVSLKDVSIIAGEAAVEAMVLDLLKSGTPKVPQKLIGRRTGLGANLTRLLATGRATKEELVAALGETLTDIDSSLRHGIVSNRIVEVPESSRDGTGVVIYYSLTQVGEEYARLLGTKKLLRPRKTPKV